MLPIWIKTRESLTCPVVFLPGLAPTCLSRPISYHIVTLVLCRIAFFHFLNLCTTCLAIGPLHVHHAPSAGSTFPSPKSTPRCSDLSSLMLPY